MFIDNKYKYAEDIWDLTSKGVFVKTGLFGLKTRLVVADTLCQDNKGELCVVPKNDMSYLIPIKNLVTNKKGQVRYINFYENKVREYAIKRFGEE